MLFCTSYLYVSANLIENILPQAKTHAAHGKNHAAHGEKTPRHLVKTPGHVI